MTALAEYAVGIGAIHALAGLALLGIPHATQQAVVRFPRHAWSGRILAAIAVTCSVMLVREMPLGWFDDYKVSLFLAGPILYLLIVLFMDELLAARSLGGILLLAAAPVLEAASFRPEATRLMLVVMAYAWVVAGMGLVLSPFRFRTTAAVLCATPTRCRLLGGVTAAFGGLLVGLGIRVF